MVPKENAMTLCRGPGSTTRADISYKKKVFPNKRLGSGRKSPVVSMGKGFALRGVLSKYQPLRKACEEGCILGGYTLQTQATNIFSSSNFFPCNIMKFPFMASGSLDKIPLNFVYGVAYLWRSREYCIEYGGRALRLDFARVTRPARVMKFFFQLASFSLKLSLIY